ncbi:MAG: endonuclease/exonuclease/phosphatase family protein [Clostridia bacterium]|nr:endonuclease/exonuclease/phosphatase family protein [Clostridia bacterium]
MLLKLMTSNVWADVFGNPVHPRDKLLCELVRDEKPDVLFLQEMHPNWHKSDLKPCLSALGYTESIPDLHGNDLNYTPVFYRKDRFLEIESEFVIYGGPNDYSSKSVSFSLLKDKASETVFGVSSTHMYFSQDEKGDSARISNTLELSALFAKYRNAKAIFCGGDFNCDVHSEPFRILNSSGIRCCSLENCDKKHFIRTHHENPVYDSQSYTYVPADPSIEGNDFSIDHIVFKGNAKILSYDVICNEKACMISDHCPVVVTAEIY